MTAKKRKSDLIRRGRYPWVKWFSMPNFTLYRGLDYDVPSEKFAQQVRNRVVGSGKEARLTVTEASIEVVLRRRKPWKSDEGGTT